MRGLMVLIVTMSVILTITSILVISKREVRCL